MDGLNSTLELLLEFSHLLAFGLLVLFSCLLGYSFSVSVTDSLILLSKKTASFKIQF